CRAWRRARRRAAPGAAGAARPRLSRSARRKESSRAMVAFEAEEPSMRFIALLAAAALSLAASAQDWPKHRPIHIVVGFAPASTTDLVARLVAPKLAEALGQSVIGDNRPGAGGNIAAQHGKRPAPDGYTVFVTSVAYAVNPSLYANAGYDPIQDFVPVILGPSTPNIIAVNPAVPATNPKNLFR